MRDRDRRPALGEPVERLLHEPLGLGVERARRLVEHEHRRVAQDRPRDRDPLLLAAREAVAALADDGVVAVRAARRSRGGSAPPGRLPRSPRRSRPGLAKRRFSRTDAWKRYVSCETTPTRLASDAKVQVADVDAVDRDAAAVDVVEPRDEVAERRLAGAGLADDRGRRPGRDRRSDDVLQRPARRRSGTRRRRRRRRRARPTASASALARRCRPAGRGTRRSGRRARATSARRARRRAASRPGRRAASAAW